MICDILQIDSAKKKNRIIGLVAFPLRPPYRPVWSARHDTSYKVWEVLCLGLKLNSYHYGIYND